MTDDEKHHIILSTFLNPRYGISPTCTHGAMESHARRHHLKGEEYTSALESAVAAGLIAMMAGSSISIRNAGRKLLPR